MFCFKNQFVQIGIFCIPKLRICNFQYRCSIFGNTSYCYNCPVSVFNRNLYICRRVEFHVKFYFRKHTFDFSFYMIIADCLLRTFQNVHIPENTAHTEFILVFQIGAITPLHYQHCHSIRSILKQISNIKLAGHM